MSDAGQPAQNPPEGAVRLIFEYDGDDVRLVSQQRVDMAVTGFDLPAVRAAGNYVEVRDADGAALTWVPARAAFAGSAEVFPERPGEPITRVDVERPQGAFTVVVPAPAGAQQVAVVRVQAPPPPPDEEEPGAGAGPGGLAPGAESHDLATFALETSG
jgi:hypothetical protein